MRVRHNLSYNNKLSGVVALLFLCILLSALAVSFVAFPSCVSAIVSYFVLNLLQPFFSLSKSNINIINLFVKLLSELIDFPVSLFIYFIYCTFLCPVQWALRVRSCMFSALPYRG